MMPHRYRNPGLLSLLICSAALWSGTLHADDYDAAVAHAGRSATDQKRDPLDHPADILRLSGIKPGMTVADVLAGDGYYSELLSYAVGPQGKVLLINNAAFENWSGAELPGRLRGGRLANVEHRTLNLDHMDLPPASLDAVFLVKVYHDLYWVDSAGFWPKVDASGVLDQLIRALKPGGALVLVDHSAKSGTGSSAATPLHRIDEAFAVQDFEKHGLKVTANSNVLRKPEDARDEISFKGAELGKTDRFAVVFRKGADAARPREAAASQPQEPGGGASGRVHPVSVSRTQQGAAASGR